MKWIIYNTKTGKQLSPSKWWRTWQGAKQASTKYEFGEVSDAAWYSDNKERLTNRPTEL